MFPAKSLTSVQIYLDLSENPLNLYRSVFITALLRVLHNFVNIT